MDTQIVSIEQEIEALGTEPNESEWRAIGVKLGSCEKTLTWWIGDWWEAGARLNRKRIVRGQDWQGPAYHTCKSAGWVARIFKRCRRRHLLSYSHHREVSGIEEVGAQDKLLDWAQDNTISALTLRKKVKELRLQAAPPAAQVPAPEPAESVQEVIDAIKSAAQAATPDPPTESKFLQPEDITGLLGGKKVSLELTAQEFKIFNQAVNPQCSGNEEQVFALKFIQSVKTRYRTIKQII